MKALREWDSVGWGFLGIGFIVLYGPILYGMWSITNEDQRATPFPFVVAAFGAMTVSGIITATVNSILQKLFEARLEAEKKQSKKKKN
ncbi:MAG: hypothetical protein VCD00_12190 [Candidatus Hydrogenedentota bacterium]